VRRTVAVLGLVLAVALPAFASQGEAANSTRESLTVAFAGDVLIHSSVWRSAEAGGGGYDFRPMFRPTRHFIAGADLAVCHLESPLSDDSVGLSGFPRFNAPREIADALKWAGFRGCSLASNHSNDQGPDGIVQTIAVMEEAGLLHSGMRSSREQSGIAYYEVAGVTVANISATYGLNGLDLPASLAWMVQMLDAGQILELAAEARAMGADLVVASIHCCVEYRTMPTDSQRALATRLIQSPDVDLVVTHHSHVVGPVEWVDGKPVLHGLGNMLSNQSARAGLPANTQDGVIAVVTATRGADGWAFTDVGVVPTWVDEPQQRHVIRVARPGSVPFQRTMSAINMMGFETSVYELESLPVSVITRLD
jgi:poly-gamma-glutamate capsule biosynthesis protein CapA/YwtB (metallophosphatase superfamily)